MALTPNTQTGPLTGKQKGTNDTLKGIDNGDFDLINGDAFKMHDRSRGGNDRLIGGDNNRANEINGDASEMYDNARGGNDLIIGGNGTLFYDQLDGDAVSMYGHSRGGNDIIKSGNSGFSILHGDAWFMFDCAIGGNDVLISGTGAEIMYGDGQEIGSNVTTGSDIFVFGPDNAFDLIGDFRQTDHDKIDVKSYGFSGIGDPDLHIQVIVDFGTEIVFGDVVDGNSVTLLGFTDPLTASNFIF